MRTARTLEAEWGQVLRGSVSTGTKEDESSTGRVWAVGFHLVTARSRLARVSKLMNVCFFNFQIFSGRGNPRILKQRIRGHACVCCTFFMSRVAQPVMSLSYCWTTGQSITHPASRSMVAGVSEPYVCVKRKRTYSERPAIRK
jgi:hypothetical protein